MFTCLQVNREDYTQCHQHGLLQLPRFCREQPWFPENCGRQNTPVWCGGLQHKAGNRWVCGQCAVVQIGTCPLKLVSTRAFILSWAKKMPTSQFKLKEHMVVSLLLHLTVLQISYICIYFKSVWQILMALNRLSIKLEIKLDLPHHICHHLLSFSWIILPACLIIFQWRQCYMNYSTFVELCTIWA